MKFFGSILFQNKPQQRIPKRLLDKYGHMFIIHIIKIDISSGRKLVYTVEILISEQIPFAVVFYFG